MVRLPAAEVTRRVIRAAVRPAAAVAADIIAAVAANMEAAEVMEAADNTEAADSTEAANNMEVAVAVVDKQAEAAVIIQAVLPLVVPVEAVTPNLDTVHLAGKSPQQIHPCPTIKPSNCRSYGGYGTTQIKNYHRYPSYDIFDAPGSALGPRNGSERCIPKCFAEKGDRVGVHK